MVIRNTTNAPEGTVLFLVGMRVNQLWAIHKWLPVTIAMRKMLIEQIRNPELGMIGEPRNFSSGRIVMVQQYWKSFEHLDAYAKNPERSHLPAWRAYNKAIRGNSAVGVFHETYILSAHNHETIYVNQPQPILLAAAVGEVQVGSKSESSRNRIEG